MKQKSWGKPSIRRCPFSGSSFYANLRSPELVAPLIVDERQKESAEKYLLSLAGIGEEGLQGISRSQDRSTVALEIIEFAKESRVI